MNFNFHKNHWSLLSTTERLLHLVSLISVWCISGVWIPCWAGCLLWLLGAIMCIWCAPTGDLSDKLFRFTFIERFVLLQAVVRLLWLFGGDVVPTLVPTWLALVAAWGDSPELSVVGADGFDEVLCEAKSLPPLAPAGPPLPPVEPAEPPVTVFEHLRHFGSQEWRRTNFRYSFLTCKSEAEPARPNETSLTVREKKLRHVRDSVRMRHTCIVLGPAHRVCRP